MMQQLAHTWDARLYTEKHSFVFDYGTSLIELLAPEVGERILDLGCGSGELTQMINGVANDVVGIDKSADMIARAQSQFPSCKFRVGDAANFQFDTSFDAIFSNAALHWVTDYKKAIQCMYVNLKKGSRIVLEFGGKDNVRAIVENLTQVLRRKGFTHQADLDLWYFPSIAEYSLALEEEGFKVVFAQWYERPTELADVESGIKDWLSMFGSPFFEGVKQRDSDEIMNQVQENLRPILFKEGKWFADYKRLRIVAYK